MRDIELRGCMCVCVCVCVCGVCIVNPPLKGHPVAIRIKSRHQRFFVLFFIDIINYYWLVFDNHGCGD